MGMNDIKTEIAFGAGVCVTKQLVDEAKTHDFVDYKKEGAARDLGMKIAEEKGWDVREDGDLIFMDMRLYVFTPMELKDYMDAKFKAKLRHMAATEEYLSPAQREALIIQSERF